MASTSSWEMAKGLCMCVAWTLSMVAVAVVAVGMDGFGEVALHRYPVTCADGRG